MQLHIGMTSVDLVHENGSLLAKLEDLCACFGLTDPEYRELETHMPKARPCRQGYVPLGAFLAAMSHFMQDDFNAAMTEQRTREQLRELELRTHNYIFLLGALGHDLLGSPLGSMDGESGSGDSLDMEQVTERRKRMAADASLKRMKGELTMVCQRMRYMGDLGLAVADLLEDLPKRGQDTANELYGTAMNLLDLMHTSCWEYTQWFGRYSACFIHLDKLAGNRPDSQQGNGADACGQSPADEPATNRNQQNHP